LRAVILEVLPNPDRLSDDELFAAGKELLMAGAIGLVQDGESIRIEMLWK